MTLRHILFVAVPIVIACYALIVTWILIFEFRAYPQTMGRSFERGGKDGDEQGDDGKAAKGRKLLGNDAPSAVSSLDGESVTSIEPMTTSEPQHPPRHSSKE